MFSNYTKDLKCEFCGRDMILDDIDYNFKGNQDDYLICPCCDISCIAKIRYGRVISTDFDVSRFYEEYLIHCEFSDVGDTSLMSFDDYLKNVLKEKEKCTD